MPMKGAMKRSEPLSRLLSSSQEMEDLGKELGRIVSTPAVIAFHGDLGAGKTTFIKGLVCGAALVSSREVNSPTFTYLNIYIGTKEIYHFDLYRLKGSEDFLVMGFDEYFNKGICCIEWAERIPDLLPPGSIHIHIQSLGETKRKITISSNRGASL